MAASNQPESGGSSESGPGSRKGSPVATALKWIAGVTAVISLLLGLNQVTGLWQKFRIHHKEFSEAMKAGEQQQERGDYPAAFDSFKHAVGLDPIDRDAQKHQAQAAMLWLENVRTRDRSFTDITNQLLPVLDKSLSNAKGQDAADLMAHIGWANFLRYRDGSTSPELITRSYAEAIKVDPHNPYANAMWGHWILWQNGDPKAAKEHFAAALESGRVRPFVRQLQLSAYSNSSTTANQAELLRITNDMRKHGEPIDEHLRDVAFRQIFDSQFDDLDRFGKVIQAVSPEDVLATYDWLGARRGDSDLGIRVEFIAAYLLELAGQRADALAKYQALQQRLRQSGPSYGLSAAVDKAVQRLSGGKS